MEKLITLQKVSKKYGNTQVISDVSLSIYKNQSVVFTGKNGCGKSTLLKMIAGLAVPSGGVVRCHEKLLFHYVPDRFPKLNLTVRQYLKRICEIDGRTSEALFGGWEQLCEEFLLTDRLEVQLKHLSKGTLQKVGVIQALMKKPDILLLDEPLSGQDLESQNVFTEKINELRELKVTIIMACHEPYLIECISDAGYTVDSGVVRPFEIKKRAGGKEFILNFAGGENARLPEAFRPYIWLNGDGCRAIAAEGASNQMIYEMIQNGWTLREMKEAGSERTGKIPSAEIFQGL